MTKQFQVEERKVVKLTSREKRFIRFASVEYDGQLYMTPQDFLESVVEADPRRKKTNIKVPSKNTILGIFSKLVS